MFYILKIANTNTWEMYDWVYEDEYICIFFHHTKLDTLDGLKPKLTVNK